MLMPSGSPPADVRARAGVFVVVALGHVAVLALLIVDRAREADPAADPRMTLVFVEPLGDAPSPVSVGRPKRATRSTAAANVPAQAPPVAGRDAALPDPPSAIHWYAGASDAARRATAVPATRDFGFTKRAPAPREKKPFAWDAVH